MLSCLEGSLDLSITPVAGGEDKGGPLDQLLSARGRVYASLFLTIYGDLQQRPAGYRWLQTARCVLHLQVLPSFRTLYGGSEGRQRQ